MNKTHNFTGIAFSGLQSQRKDHIFPLDLTYRDISSKWLDIPLLRRHDDKGPVHGGLRNYKFDGDKFLVDFEVNDLGLKAIQDGDHFLSLKYRHPDVNSRRDSKVLYEPIELSLCSDPKLTDCKILLSNDKYNLEIISYNSEKILIVDKMNEQIKPTVPQQTPTIPPPPTVTPTQGVTPTVAPTQPSPIDVDAEMVGKFKTAWHDEWNGMDQAKQSDYTWKLSEIEYRNSLETEKAFKKSVQEKLKEIDLHKGSITGFESMNFEKMMCDQNGINTVNAIIEMSKQISATKQPTASTTQTTLQPQQSQQPIQSVNDKKRPNDSESTQSKSTRNPSSMSVLDFIMESKRKIPNNFGGLGNQQKSGVVALSNDKIGDTQPSKATKNFEERYFDNLNEGIQSGKSASEYLYEYEKKQKKNQ